MQVAGLPKDPATWSLSDHGDSGSVLPAHSVNAVQRFWRPEILGCSVSGEDLDFDEKASLGGSSKRSKGSKARNPFLVQEQTLVVLSKDEIARIQSKAIKVSRSCALYPRNLTLNASFRKLAFNRDVEVLSSTTQPASTLATFSFTIPSTQPINTPAVAVGTAADWDSALFPAASAAPSSETTYHASCLLVWSHADATRSEAIRATLKAGAKAKSEAIQRGAKAASAGKKLGARLAQQMASPMGALLRDGRDWVKGDAPDGENDVGYSTSCILPL